MRNWKIHRIRPNFHESSQAKFAAAAQGTLLRVVGISSGPGEGLQSSPLYHHPLSIEILSYFNIE